MVWHLMTLLAGFAIAAQNRALSQARILDRVMELEEERIAVQSVRALALPLIGERLLDGEVDGVVEVVVGVKTFAVVLEPIQRREWYRTIVAP